MPFLRQVVHLERWEHRGSRGKPEIKQNRSSSSISVCVGVTSLASPERAEPYERPGRLQRRSGGIVRAGEPCRGSDRSAGSGSGRQRSRRPQRGRFAEQRASGSGVILDASGYIVTNAHVTEGSRDIDVSVADVSDPARKDAHRHYAARVVGTDDGDVILAGPEDRRKQSADL